MQLHFINSLIIICSVVSAYKNAYEHKDTVMNKDFWSSSKERYRNCQEILSHGFRKSGVYIIHPLECCKDKKIKVYCDQTTDGGGWTVIQRRADFEPHEDFYRTWMEYALGFGRVDREFWLGLDNIHALTNQQMNELRIDISNKEEENRYANYDFFYVHPRSMQYLLEVNGYSGTAGDSFSYHHGHKFTTKDNDFDLASNNCAELNHGAWWYRACYYSNLNGRYGGGTDPANISDDGIVWYTWNGNFYSHKRTEMKIRPKFSFNEV